MAAQTAKDSKDPLTSVNVFIGTGQDGHTFPGATTPFGMAQLSPDTQIRYFKQSYKMGGRLPLRRQNHPRIFPHHFSGTGHSDLGDFLLQPISGEVKLEPGEIDQPHSGYRSRFNHNAEIAEPGYYAVLLEDYGVRAELTASPRVGVHRYTFPAGLPANVLMDLRSSIYNYPGKVHLNQLRKYCVILLRQASAATGQRRRYFRTDKRQPVTGAVHERSWEGNNERRRSWSRQAA